jgi:hypothetical protein
MKGQRVAAFGCPHPRRGLTAEGNLLATEAGLIADHATGAALALQAMANGDARWFALNREVKLSATAGGPSGGHGSAPWLSMCAKKCWCGLMPTMAFLRGGTPLVPFLCSTKRIAPGRDGKQPAALPAALQKFR